MRDRSVEQQTGRWRRSRPATALGADAAGRRCRALRENLPSVWGASASARRLGLLAIAARIFPMAATSPTRVLIRPGNTHFRPGFGAEACVPTAIVSSAPPERRLLGAGTQRVGGSVRTCSAPEHGVGKPRSAIRTGGRGLRRR